MKKLLHGLTVLGVIAAVASCAEPPSSQPSASTPQAAIAEALHTRASAYPGARIEDLVVNGAVACARIQFTGRRSHALYAVRRGDEWIVAAPLLMEAGSWDLPGNRQVSEANQETCRNLNAALPVE